MKGTIRVRTTLTRSKAGEETNTYTVYLILHPYTFGHSLSLSSGTFRLRSTHARVRQTIIRPMARPLLRANWATARNVKSVSHLPPRLVAKKRSCLSSIITRVSVRVTDRVATGAPAPRALTLLQSSGRHVASILAVGGLRLGRGAAGRSRPSRARGPFGKPFSGEASRPPQFSRASVLPSGPRLPRSAATYLAYRST